MKNIIVILFMFLSVNTFSQLSKDQWLIGGNALFSYSQSKQLKLSTLQISPGAGYFFKDRIASGIRLGFSAETNYSGEKFRNTTISIAPFLRYYFFQSVQKVNLFADAGFGFAWSKYKNFTYNQLYTYNYHSLSFMIGSAVFLNEHTALEITLGYTYLSRGPVDSTVTNRLQIGIGLQIHLGKSLK